MCPRRAALLTPPSATLAFLQNVANSCICHTSENSPVTPIIATDPKCAPVSLVFATLATPSPRPQFHPLLFQSWPHHTANVALCFQAVAGCSPCNPFIFMFLHGCPGGGWVTSAGPPLSASFRTPSVLTNVRCRTMRPIVKGSSPVYVYVTVQLQRTARQYAWHAEPGSPAGVPYAGGRAAQRGKPLQERPCS